MSPDLEPRILDIEGRDIELQEYLKPAEPTNEDDAWYFFKQKFVIDGLNYACVTVFQMIYVYVLFKFSRLAFDI